MTQLATQQPAGRQPPTFVGPSDNGRRMTLDEFERAEGVPGYVYELNKGVVIVMDVPAIPHGLQLDELREQLSAYRRAKPGKIFTIFGGADSKVLLQSLHSERHPDLSVYLYPPDEPGNWAAWVPDIVVEVISPSSRQRDYEEKPDEYLLFGVREYWIVDRMQGELVVHRRVGGQWKVRPVKPPERYESKLLPGLQVDVQAMFDAAARCE